MEHYHKYNDLLLKEYPAFIYEVEIFKGTQDSWNLEESSMYKSATIINDLVDFVIYTYAEYKLFKYTNLIAAPLKWLQENAITIELETAKEKRKRIKTEKELKKELNES